MSEIPRRTVLVGDAASELRRLPSASVDMVLTSPPYFRLRNYQVEGQLGLEPSVSEWVAGLRAVMHEVARVLVPTGTLWLNLGDSYSTDAAQGAPRKSLLLGPERLALALLEDGWCLRNKIVWAKTNPMPSPARDRLSTTYEIVYLLARQRDYYFDLDSVRQPHRSTLRPPRRPPRDFLPEAWRGPNGDTASGLAALKAAGQVGHPLGKNPGDVWAFGTAGYRGAHFATFPRALAQGAIWAGCPEARCRRCRAPWRRKVLRAMGGRAVRSTSGPTCRCGEASQPGLVLDPFLGAGTTAVAAEALDRDWLGVELNPEFAALAGERIQAARKKEQAA